MQKLKEIWVRSLGREDPLEKEMATHCSILAWRIPRTEKPGGLQFMIKKRHDFVAKPPPNMYNICWVESFKSAFCGHFLFSGVSMSPYTFTRGLEPAADV